MSNQKKKQKVWYEAIEETLLPHKQGEELIPLSVILPVYNCSEVIDTTLESIENQNYLTLEVIIIDAGSTDRTLEIVNNYASMISRIYTVTDFNIPDMLNRGISLATSRYLTFLFPGTSYLSNMTYQYFATSAAQQDFPDVLYCGSIQREINHDPLTIYQSFEEKFFYRGEQPAMLPASWIRRDLFEKTGKFNPHFLLRPGYEFFCRLQGKENVRVAMIERILVDFDYGRFSYGKVLRIAAETWSAISRHFGFFRALLWLFTVNHVIIVKWLGRRLKALFEK